jgi:hypothetical protein
LKRHTRPHRRNWPKRSDGRGPRGLWGHACSWRRRATFAHGHHRIAAARRQSGGVDLQATQSGRAARLHAGTMHTEIGAAGSADGADLWRRRLPAFSGRRPRRRRSGRLRRRGGRLVGGRRRRSWRCGGWRGRCCSRRCWCRLRRCGRRRRALCRRWSNGVERRLARWRYFGSITLETFKRIPSARLDASALRHEVGAARRANR